MAQNNNNGGCLGAILAFCLIGGNAFIFTGALTDELSDNPFAWIMVIIAVIADFWLVGWGFSALGKSLDQKKLLKINGYKNSYTLKTIELGSRRKFRSNSDKADENSEINRLYDNILRENEDLVAKINEIANRQIQIFSSTSEEDNGIYLSHLKSHESELSSNSNIFKDLYSKLTSKRIRILKAENGLKFMDLKRAVSSLSSADKFSGAIDFRSFYHVSYSPQNYFEFTDEPLILTINSIDYYFTPNAILAFFEREFICAFNPSAFSVKCEECSVKRYSYPVPAEIGNDSEIFQIDVERYRYLHTCVDGTPDLRYSNNPKIPYTTKEDYYRYAKLSISVAGEKVNFFVSSYAKAKKFADSAQKYSETLQLRDYTFDFTKLIAMCSDNESAIYNILSALSDRPKKSKLCEFIEN